MISRHSIDIHARAARRMLNASGRSIRDDEVTRYLLTILTRISPPNCCSTSRIPRHGTFTNLVSPCDRPGIPNEQNTSNRTCFPMPEASPSLQHAENPIIVDANDLLFMSKPSRRPSKSYHNWVLQAFTFQMYSGPTLSPVHRKPLRFIGGRTAFGRCPLPAQHTTQAYVRPRRKCR